MDEAKKFESGWNLASAIIIELSRLLQSASSCYVNGNIGKAFYYLRAVRMRISSNLEKEEKGKLTEKEGELYENINLSKTHGFSNPSEKTIKARRKVFELYGEYNDLLMDYLKQYGYLIPAKKDRTKMN